MFEKQNNDKMFVFSLQIHRKKNSILWNIKNILWILGSDCRNPPGTHAGSGTASRLDQYWWWSIQYWDWKLRTGWNRIRSVFSVYCYQFLFTTVFLSDSDNQYFRELNKIIFCLVFLIRNFRAGFELNGVFVQQKPRFLLRQKRLSKIFHFRFFRKCWWPPSTVLWTQNSVFFKNVKMFSKAIYHEETFELL